MLGKTLAIMVMILANVVKKASSTLNFRIYCLKEAVLPAIYHAVNYVPHRIVNQNQFYHD